MLASNSNQINGKPLRLRRVHHTEEIVAGFSKLLKSESMTDVTLICSGGQTIRAHQVILATFSPYFRAIFEAQPFTNNPCQYPVIVIKDLAFSELRAILEFIYRGEVSISRDKLSLVLQAAKALEVSGLNDLKVESTTSVSNGASTGGGIPISSSSSTSSSSLAQVADSSDLMDNSILASLHHNSMSAINAVSSSGLNGSKRAHESLIYPAGFGEGLKKARMTFDQQTDSMQSIDRIGLSLLESGINLSNNPMATRLGQNNHLNRSILDMMSKADNRDRMNDIRQMKQKATEHLIKERQLRQQILMQQQRNCQQNKQAILQQHLLQKNSSPSKSPPENGDHVDTSSPNYGSSPEQLVKRGEGSSELAETSELEEQSKNDNNNNNNSTSTQEDDKPNDLSSSDAEHSIESSNVRDENKSVDCESGQNENDDSGCNRESKNCDYTNNGENKSSSTNGEEKDAGEDDKPLELTIDHGSNNNNSNNNNSGEDDLNGEDDQAEKRSSSDDRHLVKTRRSLLRNVYYTNNGNCHATDDGGNNSPKVKQEIDIDEEPIMIQGNGEMDDYVEQDDMNGDNEDYDGMGKGWTSPQDLVFQKQQELRFQQIQRQQYEQALLQLQADHQEAKLLEFYEQLQHATALSRFAAENDVVDPSTVISLDWKEGFIDEPGKTLDHHSLNNQLALNRSLAGLVSNQNGLLAGRDLKNNSNNNKINTNGSNTNSNGTIGSTPMITPDFLQPRGPGRPRKGNKAQDISPCPECNKVFVRPDVLKLHYRSVHLNERHPCNLCPKIFKWPGDLSKHKRTKHPEALAAAAAAKANT